MAIDVCSEISSPGISPRISFSHDLNQRNTVPIEDHRLDSSLLDSSSDFNFCIVNNLTLELSSADELFSNGKILPAQIKKSNFIASKNTHHQNEPPKPPVHHPSTEINNTEKKRLKEFLSASFDAEEEEDEKPARAIQLDQHQVQSKLQQFRKKPRNQICRDNNLCQAEDHRFHLVQVTIIQTIIQHRNRV